MGSKRDLEKVKMPGLCEKTPVVRTLEDKLCDAFADENAQMLKKAGSESCFQVVNNMIAANNKK